MKRDKRKVRLSDESLPYFEFGLKPRKHDIENPFFSQYPMDRPRNDIIKQARGKAIECIMANQVNGNKLIIPNFSRKAKDDFGFGRVIFHDVLNHTETLGFIARERQSDHTRSIIEYRPKAREFIPDATTLYPDELIVLHIEEKDSNMAKVDTEQRRALKRRLKEIGQFYEKQSIETGIDRNTFDLFNEVESNVYRKEQPLAFPNPAKIIPYMVFNDKDLTKGGRLYGAFWIGCKKEFRRAITINGELTSDIDGKGMHVQLLYRLEGMEMPDGDPYLFKDSNRSIAKKAMLLMMNTRKVNSLNDGRRAVIRTYKKRFDKKVDETTLFQMILELESFHQPIIHLLYKPNWGRLQHTEAAIMMNIIEMGMRDDVVILPVHDGCLCRRSDRDRVLHYFDRQGIKAEENIDHLKPLPIEETKKILDDHRRLLKA